MQRGEARCMSIKLWCVAQKVKRFVSEPLTYPTGQPCADGMSQRPARTCIAVQTL